MSISRFTHRSMTKSVKLLPRKATFLIDKFFKEGKVHPASTVDKNKLTYSPKMAPFCYVGSAGIQVAKDTYTVETVTFPKIRLYSKYSGLDLENTSFNNPNIYIDTTPDQQMSADINDQLQKMKDMIYLRKEWMAGKMFSAGTFTYNDTVNKIKYTVDYGRNGNLINTVTTKWDNSSSTPKSDIMNMVDLILQYGASGAPKAMVFGDLAYNAAMENESFLALLNNRRVELGAIKPIAGEYYFGDIMGMECYRYSMKDSDGNYIIPQKGIVFLSSGNEYFFDYGPVHETLGLIQTSFFSKMYEQQNPPGKFIVVESNPLVMCFDINGTGIMYVLS